MNFEETLACFVFYFRFIIIIAAVIIPILLLSLLIYSVFKQRYKRSRILIGGMLVSIVFVCLVFLDFRVPASIDIASLKQNKEEIISLKSGEYEFDAGYIFGYMYVYDEKEFALYEPTIEISEVYDVDDDTICSVSLVTCYKDERFSHAFFPMLSSGEILIENEKKIIEIYYCYDNAMNPFCSITNPSLFYRQKIDFVDVLRTYTVRDQSD